MAGAMLSSALLSLPSAASASAVASFFFIISVSIVFFRCQFLLLRRRPPPAKSLPCPESYPVIGNLIGFLRNRHRFHDWTADMLSQTPTSTLQVNGFLGLSNGICTADPLNLRHILAVNFSNYIKGSRYHDILRDLLGDGIFAVDGHLWAAQRKIASYEFSTRSLKHFIAGTVNFQITHRLIPFLSEACDDDRVIDLQEVLQKFAFENICNVAFGVDPLSLDAGTISPFIQAFNYAIENVASRFMSPLPMIWKIKRFLDIGSEKRFKEAVKVIDQFALSVIRSKEDMIKAKREEGDAELGSNQDLLSRFMLSGSHLENEDSEHRRKFLRDIVISFVLAGKDSTSTALTWFFWLVAGHPSCERRILDELTMSGKVSEGNFSYDDLKELHYVHASVSESMRLFPPVPIDSRLTVSDDVLPDGSYVGKGWFADYSAYSMGRNSKVWGDDCREFRPERWLDDAGRYQSQDQFRYPVFHCGPRMCLGKDMAYIQMKSIVAAVMPVFEILPVDGGGTTDKMTKPGYELSLTLKMRDGLPVRLRRRSSI